MILNGVSLHGPPAELGFLGMYYIRIGTKLRLFSTSHCTTEIGPVRSQEHKCKTFPRIHMIWNIKFISFHRKHMDWWLLVLIGLFDKKNAHKHTAHIAARNGCCNSWKTKLKGKQSTQTQNSDIWKCMELKVISNIEASSHNYNYIQITPFGFAGRSENIAPMHCTFRISMILLATALRYIR